MKRDFALRYRDLVQWHWWFRGRRKILHGFLAKKFDHRKPLSVAVLGCGPAEGARWLLKIAAPGARIVAVDIDINQARETGAFLRYVVGSAEAPPLRPRSFDLILALDVMEHLDDDVRGVSESAQLLKDGGLLIVSVPALPSLWGGQDAVSEHRRRYTKRSLLNLFGRAQLPQPRVTYFNTFLFPPIAAVRWTRRLMRTGSDSRSDFEASHPGLLNEILAAIFGFERHLVGRIALPIGTSLLAVHQMTPARMS